jgi:putative transport protein
MSLLGGVISISNTYTFFLVLFGVLLFGYLIGRITIKGVSLGDAGVFIIALFFGALFFNMNEAGELLFAASSKPYDFSAGLTIVEALGLILFVTSVGYIAGPKFFGNFKKNFKSYVLLGVVIILVGGLSAIGCILAGDAIGYGSSIETREGFVAMIVGLLSGSLTSTPAFSAAKATVAAEYTGLVSVGHGIAYIFGVVGVVLFVQIIPKLTKANMDEERAKLVIKEEKKEEKKQLKLFEIDHMGIAGFSLAAILGTIVGQIKIPLSAEGLSGTCFSLTTTGGCLLMSLILGHFGRLGRISIMPKQSTLKLFRELGLVLFLVGAGIPGGAEFVANFDPMYFVYGVVMTIFPLIAGYLFAKYVLKLSLLNNLGSITGGMTSTPALGTLISTAGTEDVAAAYAATYPIALIAVVLVSQLLVIMF